MRGPLALPVTLPSRLCARARWGLASAGTPGGIVLVRDRPRRLSGHSLIGSLARWLAHPATHSFSGPEPGRLPVHKAPPRPPRTSVGVRARAAHWQARSRHHKLTGSLSGHWPGPRLRVQHSAWHAARGSGTSPAPRLPLGLNFKESLPWMALKAGTRLVHWQLPLRHGPERSDSRGST